MNLWIQFRNKKTHVGVSYDYKTSGKLGGGNHYYYLDGDFTPDDLLEREKNSLLPTEDQKRDDFIKEFVSAEELSACYTQACEYYEILCSVLED